MYLALKLVLPYVFICLKTAFVVLLQMWDGINRGLHRR